MTFIFNLSPIYWMQYLLIYKAQIVPSHGLRILTLQFYFLNYLMWFALNRSWPQLILNAELLWHDFEALLLGLVYELSSSLKILIFVLICYLIDTFVYAEIVWALWLAFISISLQSWNRLIMIKMEVDKFRYKFTRWSLLY